ncbi:MAG: phage holin family protein [Chloroflexi bacterium]|nr:phage holin family protein [Chloroflexota bacterium]
MINRFDSFTKSIVIIWLFGGKMKSFLIRLLINAVALYVTIQFIPGIYFSGGIDTLLILAFIFGLVNAIIKPLFSFLTCGFYVITLGLFTFIANAAMLWLTGSIAQMVGIDFSIENFWAAIIGALVISIVSFVLSLFLDRKEK